MSAPAAVAVVHFDAGHDAYGNPRRAFIGYDGSGAMVAATDEGYAGTPAWVRELAFEPVRIPTTGRYLRDVLREAKAAGVLR